MFESHRFVYNGFNHVHMQIDATKSIDELKCVPVLFRVVSNLNPDSHSVAWLLFGGLKKMYFFKGAIPDGTLSSRRVVPHPSSPWADFPKCHDLGRESTI